MSGAHKMKSKHLNSAVQSVYEKKDVETIVRAYAGERASKKEIAELVSRFERGMKNLRGKDIMDHVGRSAAESLNRSGRRVHVVVGTSKGSKSSGRRLRTFATRAVMDDEDLLDYGIKHFIKPKGVDLFKERLRGNTGLVVYDVGDVINAGDPLPATRGQRIAEMIHELGHQVEYGDAKTAAAFRRLWQRRTEGSTEQPMSRIDPSGGYHPNEKSKPDRFYDPYMGKVIGDKQDATELLSMGYEYASHLKREIDEDERPYAQQRKALEWAMYDPEHFSTVLNTIAGAHK